MRTWINYHDSHRKRSNLSGKAKDEYEDVLLKIRELPYIHFVFVCSTDELSPASLSSDLCLIMVATTAANRPTGGNLRALDQPRFCKRAHVQTLGYRTKNRGKQTIKEKEVGIVGSRLQAISSRERKKKRRA